MRLGRSGWSRAGASLALTLALVLEVGPRSTAGGAPPAAALRGFSPARSSAEARWEEKFAQLPSEERAEATLHRLTEEPHMAGTDASRRVAEYLRDEYQAAGLQAEIVPYRVTLSYPDEIVLERTAPDAMRLARPELPVPGDPATADPRAVPGFSAYSPSGDLTAEIVYVNYGQPEDYDRLAEMDASVKGKIALVRYGQCFRGVKVHLAEEHGAAAVLLYSDPADDGYREGDPYPLGPWRPESGIERGSVQYTFLYPGDPFARRSGGSAGGGPQSLETERADNLPRIPALPISWRDAAELLADLRGSKVPRQWQGGLPFTYHAGPGPAAAHLKLSMRLEQKTIYDVIARLDGESRDWVLAGNHHDAWVFGAADPGSGTAVLLEAARALGELKRAGWKPRRSLLLCAWDAEEFGLVGSTQWVEEQREELGRRAIAYLNTDSAVQGERFNSAATPSLRELVREVARDTLDPRTGLSVYDRWRERAEQSAAAHLSDSLRGKKGAPAVPIAALGSGSDYTAFYHHAGIPSLDAGASGEYGVYHSIYDDFDWMKRFGDPKFTYHAMMARILGRILMRLADADVPAFDQQEYAAEIERLLGELRSAVRAAAAGQGHPLDLRPVEAAAADFRDAARESAEAVRAFVAAGPDLSRAEPVAHALAGVEAALLAPNGLSGRPWYRHTVFAPGINAGYAAVAFPGVREAVDRGDWAVARREAETLRAALVRAAGRMREAAHLAALRPLSAPP
ncbi:MAG TPA: M28 family metallopeptidase [Candidatus Binatia bacterium]|nr:M28 family metallopeptidase [Candidatus Binatia bacterium]